MADPWNPTGESFLRAGDVVLRGRSLNQQFERALAQERIQREQQDLLRRLLESEEAARFITPDQLPPEYRTPGVTSIEESTDPRLQFLARMVRTGTVKPEAAIGDLMKPEEAMALHAGSK